MIIKLLKSQTMANLKFAHPVSSEISNNILGEAKAKMGFAPNMYLKMGQNPAN